MTKYLPHFSLIATILALALSASARAGDSSTPVDSLSDEPFGSHRWLNGKHSTTFPFEIFRGDIRYDVTINGHPVKMLLDDGFMWDPILFWGSPGIDSLGLTFDGEAEVSGGIGDAEAVPARTASGITVGFPGVEIIGQEAIITAYDKGGVSSWWGSEGQLSCTLLKHFVVDINFDRMTMTLTEPDQYEYAGDGTAVPWTPMGFGPMSIPATLVLPDGRTVEVPLLMDLGYNDQLQLIPNGEHKIAPPERKLPASLGFNIQGTETLGWVGRTPSVTIAGHEIPEVICAFVSKGSSADEYSEAMVGLGILSKFNLVFDYSRRRLYMKPNGRFGDPYESDMSGLTTRPRRGYREIAAIVPGSPADEAGLKVGERIVRIDGRPAAEYDIFELKPLLKRPGAEVTVTVERDGVETDVSLALRRLI